MHNANTYMKLANKLASDKLHVDLVDQKELMANLRLLMANLDELDKFKKAIFYGKPFKSAATTVTYPVALGPSRADLAHGIIGIATEAGELLEHVHNILNGDDTADARSNIVEELGDVLWYLALCCKAVDVNLTEVMWRNLKKLSLRYPQQRFDSLDALERSYDAEQTAFDFGEEYPNHG